MTTDGAAVVAAVDPAEGAAPPADWAGHADRLIDQPAAAAWPRLDAAGARAVAACLQRACQADWARDPPRAQRAAEVLQRLARDWPAEAEVAAFAAWADALACLIQGRLADGLQQLDTAASHWQALGRPLEAARSQVPRVMALCLLGRHDEAAVSGEATGQALAALGDQAAAAKLSLNLGSLQYRREDFTAAARHYRQAAVLFARQSDRLHSVLADIGLGDALVAGGAMAEGRRIYARARMRAAQHGLPLQEALADESTALLDLAAGDYRAALGGLLRAGRTYQALGLPQQQAIADKQLAQLYLSLNLLPEAVDLLERSQARLGELAMPDDQAQAALQLGQALARLGRIGEAQAALAAAERHLAASGSAHGLAELALARADTAVQQGALGEARALAQQVLVLDPAPTWPALPLQARLLLAMAQAASGQPGEADDAAAMFQAVAVQARQSGFAPLALRAATGLGELALAAGRLDEADQHLGQAVAELALRWRQLPGDDLRNAFVADALWPYPAWLAVALARHAAEPGPAQVRQVLARLDAGRALALADRLARRLGAAASTVVEDDEAVQAWRARWRWVQRRLQQQAEEGELPSAAWLAERQQCEQALREHLRLRRGLAGLQAVLAPDPAPSAEQPAAVEPGAAVADGPADDSADDSAHVIDRLQARLAPGEVVVVWGRQGDELLAGLVWHDRVGLHRRVADWREVSAEWAATRFQLDSLRHGVAPVATHLATLGARARQRLQRLHRCLWAPLQAAEPALAAARRVMVVPVEGLHGLPWCALHDGQAWLVQRHALAEAASLRVAELGLARVPRPPRRVLALAHAAGLPQAEAEARAVAAGFAEPQLWLGVEATQQRLRAGASEADLLHLACHAEHRADNPLFSALHLADGPLHAEQVEGLPLRGPIVVLSACESGRAGPRGRDEQVGLVGAFLLAGAVRVVASHWPVADQSTAVLMGHLVPRLAAGDGPAEALRQAQCRLAEAGLHPALWAAFAVHAGW